MMECLPKTIAFEKRGHVAIFTIDRPEALNAFTREMLVGMDAGFAEFQADSDLWVAILTGRGERAFCAGMDLKDALPQITGGDEMGYEDHTKRPFSDVYKPIIAAVNGACIAGGVEFMLGTDLRLAVPHATFALAETRWGVIPTGGSHVRLPQQIPWAVAMELLLTAQTITAQRAYEVGLVNRIVEPGALMPAAIEWAEKICKNGPLAVRTAKEIAVKALQQATPFILEKSIGAKVFASEDAKEGPKAFAEKRAPRFTGR
ncbi:MAG: enoyl-CoA hydratase/isomerase family protein [Deltaproteobacteria bacterium]|nr:enoyl-CoA hydratase/isomerase family protein [Deltaproteobacteria bacterium]